MQARMKNPVVVLPDALQALLSLNKAVTREDLPPAMHQFAHLRASQLNGCSVCVDMACRELTESGQSHERIFAVAAWRDTPYFSEAERAVLALTEELTQLEGRANPVSDGVWQEINRHYGEAAVAALLVSISAINVWNRLNLAVRQPVGAWTG